ncbi:MAG: hypothetical protein ACREFS_11550 [Acetobacteraceae bacterium]
MYLAPLKADAARGNVEIGVTKNLSHIIAGNLDSFTPKPEHLLHPNLSPQGRALGGETSGHTKICLKYRLNEDDCVGFAVSKEDGSTRFTCNSRTLNTEKFRIEHDVIKNSKSQALKNLMLHNLGTTSKKSDGLLSKEWAYAIAVAVEMAFVHGLKTPGGHCEAPF